LKKYGKNPVTGEKLELKSLTKLNFYKNGNGKPLGSAADIKQMFSLN